ncbi:MAG: hypothetical protein HKO71_02065 [Pseudomonadales bacterium]|nr:hypothetical protein [Gammaproteobacteria bacterium]NNL56514.1 hypothetical protein [Pseudomonadales bacterium]
MSKGVLLQQPVSAYLQCAWHHAGSKLAIKAASGFAATGIIPLTGVFCDFVAFDRE